MKIDVASNIVVDFIHDVKGRISRNLGGPACYCGLTARQFGFEVRLATKVGTDFCVYHKEFLHDHGIALKGDQITEYLTTKFKVLVNEDDSRDLFLLSKC